MFILLPLSWYFFLLFDSVTHQTKLKFLSRPVHIGNREPPAEQTHNDGTSDKTGKMFNLQYIICINLFANIKIDDLACCRHSVFWVFAGKLWQLQKFR